MKFQPGNQFAAGSSYDLDAEAIALDEWSKRDDALHLGQFADERDIWPQRIYEWRDQSKTFAESLKKAHNRIALRITKKTHNSEYNYGIYQRYIGFYDKLLNDYERGEKRYESDLRKGENPQNSEQMVQATNKLDAVLKQVSALQKARKTDKNK